MIRLETFALLLLTAWSTHNYGQDQPNVVFISIDDLNDWIGCLKGHPQAHTPNIDRLAARGVLFSNAHCAASACNPSRAAVFSGRMPQASGVWSNKSPALSSFPGSKFLTRTLSEAGYKTLGTGKLLHKKGNEHFDEYYNVGQRWSPFTSKAVEYLDDELPTKDGENPRHVFDYKGKQYTLPLNGMPSDRAPDQKKGESFDWGPIDLPDSEFGDTQITDWAVKQLQHKHTKPFFLGVGYYRPHIPLWAPKRFFARFKESPAKLPATKSNDLDDLSTIGRQWALEPITAGSHSTVVKHGQWRAAVEAYLACISYVDHEVGRLVNALDDSNYHQNTIVVLWSDHGWQLGEKQHWGKWTGWERSTKVPLIIVPAKSDGHATAHPIDFVIGEVCSDPVGLIDIYPTLVDLCQADGPKKLDGKSLVPFLNNPQHARNRDIVTMFDSGNGSLRTNRYRYIEYANGEQELYDLAEDPNEFRNLARSPEHTTLKRDLKSRLAPYLVTP